MKLLIAHIFILVAVTVYLGCAGSQTYHKEKLPDPSSYQAHFPDMDTNGDERVDWKEFQQQFPNGDKKVYKALDINKDGGVDHDEWHAFKEAHGLRDKH